MEKADNEMYALVDEEFLAKFSNQHLNYMKKLYYSFYAGYCKRIKRKPLTSEDFFKNMHLRRFQLYQHVLSMIKIDFGHALIFLCIAGVSIPSFFFASTYLDIFAVKLGLTSVAGNTGLMRYLPAAVCIGIGCIALFSPMLANNIQKEMEQDSAFYARCRGLSEGKILLRYALPNAVVTLLPSFCQMLGLCMAGSAIVERVFSLPGLGYLIIDSVLYRDSPVIHATILFLAFSLVMFNILSDILRRILQRDASAREGARL